MTTWTRTDLEYAQRYELLGSPYAIVASGSSVVTGYGAGGHARRIGRRHFELFRDHRSLGERPTLKAAKTEAERRAARS